MENGAFALIDCLGFKGVWQRTDVQLLLDKFRALESSIETELKGNSLLGTYIGGPVDLRVQFLSDTVAISVQHGPAATTRTEHDNNRLVYLAFTAVIKTLGLFLRPEPSLAMRGCITYGEHVCDGNFLVGPAMDAAAEHMNLAEGAFVWLLPPAAIRYQEFITVAEAQYSRLGPEWIRKQIQSPEAKSPGSADLSTVINTMGDDNLLREATRLILNRNVLNSHSMPLKSGARLQCLIVNPLAFEKDADARLKMREDYSEAMMGERIDIWTKRQNTAEFLEVADRAISMNMKA